MTLSPDALNREYWEKRISEKGKDGVSTVGDVEERTAEEIHFLTAEIMRVYPSPVNMAIDFGAGWGRLFPVLWATSMKQVLVDFVEENKRIWENMPHGGDSIFMVCPIKDFPWQGVADYALTSFSLLHVLDDEEFAESVGAIIGSVKDGGSLFIYESYNESGNVAPHCSNRNREQFLKPFSGCGMVKEITWKSTYQPYETGCHQPIKLFVFRR